MSAWQATLDYAAGCGAEVDQVSDSAIVITAAGTHRLRIPVLLAVGPRYLRVQSFVARKPDESHEAVYRWLLEQNARLIGVAFSVDSFGDIYLTNPELLPDFDVVTMFHLCEFFFPNTASKAYGGLDDAKLLDLFTAKTKRGGYILFYTRSIAFNKAEPIIAKWEKKKLVKRVGEFKTLLVYRKVK